MRVWSQHQETLRASVGELKSVLNTPPKDITQASNFPTSKWSALASTGLFGEPANPNCTKGERVLGTMYALERLGEISRDGGFNFSVATHLASTVTAITQFGSTKAIQRYLPDLIAGNLIGAHAISEPNAGSDAINMQTCAVRDGDKYVLNGTKAFVTNGPIADVIIVYAKTNDSYSAGGITAFLVETNSNGLTIGNPLRKLGLTTSPLSEMYLQDCRVPAEHMIGKLSAGFLVLDYVMKREILYSFIINVGEMQHRLQRSISYANERKQFGGRIGSFQSVANKIVDMKIRYELCRQWLYHTAEKLATPQDVTTDIAIGKILVSESALSTSLDAVQIHGGYGYLEETGLGTDVTNAIAGPIYSGTNEIQRNRIASMLGLGNPTRSSNGLSPILAPSVSPDQRAPPDNTLRHTHVLDYLSSDVQQYVERVLGNERRSLREQAVTLYYAVRDGITYEVHSTDISKNGLRASAVVRSGLGFCLHKAILYAAIVRAVGIPSRIVATRVRNHLSSAQLQILIGGDVFLHWFTEIRLDGVWIKATPVFPMLLCKLYGITPLEFDGTTDSFKHSYSGGSVMEFLEGVFTFENPTYIDLIGLVGSHHPNMITETGFVPGEAVNVNKFIHPQAVVTAKAS